MLRNISRKRPFSEIAFEFADGVSRAQYANNSGGLIDKWALEVWEENDERR